MPDTFNLSDVFISYSRKDTDFVRRISSELKARKREVWVDWEDIPLTADWWAEIQAGIEAANTFIFIISPDSVASDVCRKEIDHAVAANKRFVPVLYRDLTDQAQQEMMHPIISTHNWIFFREADDFNRAFDRLLKALETDLEHARKHTRFLVRAREWEMRNRDDSYFLGATDLKEAEAWLASSGSKEPRPTDLQTEYILTSRYAQTNRQRRLLLGVSVALVVAVGLAILSIFLANQASTQATIALNNAATATIAQGQALVEANNAATQAAIAENNAATATIAQGRALVEADNAATQAAIARLAAAAEANARSTSVANEQIAVNAAVTATIAQGQALVEADNAATQAAIALDNAATATIAQGVAQVEANNAATQAAIAQIAATAEANARATSVVNEQIAVNSAATAIIAQGVAVVEADNAATQAAIALDNAATATIAQGIAQNEANNAATQAAIAENNAATATIAQGQALVEADRAATQAAIAQIAATAEANARSTSVANERLALDNAATATIAQGQALIEADRAETQAAIALDNAATATIAQGVAIHEAATAESAQATAIYNESQARAQAMAVNAEQLLEAGNTDLAIALAIEASRLNPELAQAQRLLNRANALSARLNLNSLRNDLNRMSTDERYLLTLDSPRTFILWELTTRQPIYELREHQAEISTVVFSPDAKYLISGDESGVIVIWEVAAGRALHRLNAHGARVSSLAFSPWGDPTFASGGDDATAVMWNAETGAEIFRLEGHAGPISKVAFNFESQTPEVFSYSMNTSSPGMGILPSPPDQGFRALRVYRGFSPNGQFAYTGGDGTDFLTLWDPDSLTEIRAFPLGNANQDYVTAIAFSWFDTLLVHVESRRRGQVIDRRLALWDVKTGSEIRRFDVRQDNPGLWEIYSLAMSVDGRYALSGGRFGRVFAVSLWEVATGKEIRRFTGHNEAILNVDFSAFGRYAISSTANDLRVWDISEREISQENRITPSTTAITDLGFSPDGQIIFANVAPLGLGGWNTTSGADLIIPIAIGSAPVAYSPVQPYAMTASTDPSTPFSIVTLWDMISAEYVYRDNGLPINASALAFNADGGKAVFGGIRGGVVLWDVSQRSVLRRFDTAEPITQIILSSDERLAAGLTSTNEIVLWDMIAGVETRRLGGYEGQIGKIEFSPDGNSIAAAVGEPDNTTLVWDTQTGEQLLSLLGGHRDSVNALAFSPDGESLLSASDDGSLILWDLATGQPLRRFSGHTGPVNTVAISADGRSAASANRQDGIILWRIETLEETVAWTQANRYLLELSCAQRLQYNAQPLCNQRGIVPTPTATWTPLPTATPTITPTPTLTPTATATAVPMGIIESSSAAVNLRSGAGEGFRVIAQTRPGIEVVILEVHESQAWIKVRLPDGTEGWVTSFVVRRQ